MGCGVWSVLDKRTSYNTLDFWLRCFVRYYIAMIAMSYGIIKLFGLQMYFPNLSQLSTPLGDLLPMRFSWLLIGYSTPYQFFGGAIEVIVGLLLLNRRTVTTGLLLGAALFSHVAILNLCFDIPVKLYSLHLFCYCVILLAYDAPRLARFLLFNKSVEATNLYDISFDKRWMKITRVGLKILFVMVWVIMPFSESWDQYKDRAATPIPKPFFGVYNVDTFVVKGDTVPMTASDTLRWKDIIFDKNGFGSVNAQDTTFRQLYRRSYFNYTADTVNQVLAIKKFPLDSLPMLTFHYAFASEGQILLRSTSRVDSLQLVIKKSSRHFQLAEKQFHWLSEYNR